MQKRFISVLLAVGFIIFSFTSTKPGLASFDLPANQTSHAIHTGIQAQQDQEVPTPVIIPTYPVELYTQTATPGPDGYIKHTVLEAQFLFHIADLYGVNLQEILTLNNLTVDSIINPGDILIIKKIELPTPEPTETLADLEIGDEEEEAVPLLFEPTPELTPTITPLPEVSKGLLERVFTNNSRYLAYGIFALVFLGVVLLIVSSRRIY